MTDTLPFSPRYFPASPVRSTVRQSLPLLARRPLQPSRLPNKNTLPIVAEEDRLSQGMLISMMAVTLTAAAYSLVQAWNLAGGDTLNHAVHAFIP